ncbi:MAG: hypothetical protein IT290_10835, partial [Deltaproteobacteria bacterium]|nr:hypothetical protein [Deltaproteobacteria bacterium]
MSTLLRSFLVLVTIGLASNASAELLCIKKSNVVRDGKVALQNAAVIATASCPRGYSLLLNLDTVVRDDSVTSAKIVDGAVTAADIQDGTITAADIQDGTITGAKLESATVTSANIQDGSIAANDLQIGAVASASIQDGSIGAEKLAVGVLPNSISINTTGALLASGASFTVGGGGTPGINFPESVNSTFYAGFTLPQNYTSGTAVTLEMLVHISTSTCNVRFGPNAISVTRRNSTPLVGGSIASGLTVANGGLVTFPATANTS